MPAANIPWSLGAEVLEGTGMVAREGGWGQSLGSGHVPSGVTSHKWAEWTNQTMVFPKVCAGPEDSSLLMADHSSR